MSAKKRRAEEESEDLQAWKRARNEDDAITLFEDDFRFLSTGSRCAVRLPGDGPGGDNAEPFRSVEHAFQASKSDDPLFRKAIRAARKAKEAKRLGAAEMAGKGGGGGGGGGAWRRRALDTMRGLLRDKFRRDRGLRAWPGAVVRLAEDRP